MKGPVRWATAGAALGFALGLLLSAWRAPVEVALVRSLICSVVLGATMFLAGLLNHHPHLDDESGGRRNESLT